MKMLASKIERAVRATRCMNRLAPLSMLLRALCLPVLVSCGGGEKATGTTTPTPVSVPTPATFASISAGASHSCGVTAAGVGYCWGLNNDGQLGTGTFVGSSVPVPVTGGLTFASISTGDYHSCGVTTTGAAYCWGEDSGGEIDGGSTALSHGPCGVGGGSSCSASPVAVAVGITFKSISVGILHTCGVTPGGAAYCWGYNKEGLGGDSTANCPTQQYFCAAPQKVAGGLTFASVSAGTFISCGLTTTGAAYCWGDNGYGELGVGTTVGPQQCAVETVDGTPGTISCSRVPVAVAGGFTFSSVHAENVSACGVTLSGAALCWGVNAEGRLGDGDATTTARSSPVPVAGALVFATITDGGMSGFVCGVTTAGQAYCWGANRYGSLGNGTLNGPICFAIFTCSTVPVAVAGGLKFASVSAGGEHTCGLTTGGEAYCWGRNVQGQLGDNTRTDAVVPVRVVSRP
jgi:alpha-tubulin suppressor-like RCC1 family protein